MVGAIADEVGERQRPADVEGRLGDEDSRAALSSGARLGATVPSVANNRVVEGEWSGMALPQWLRNDEIAANPEKFLSDYNRQSTT